MVSKLWVGKLARLSSCQVLTLGVTARNFAMDEEKILLLNISVLRRHIKSKLQRRGMTATSKLATSKVDDHNFNKHLKVTLFS